MKTVLWPLPSNSDADWVAAVGCVAGFLAVHRGSKKMKPSRRQRSRERLGHNGTNPRIGLFQNLAKRCWFGEGYDFGGWLAWFVSFVLGPSGLPHQHLLKLVAFLNLFQ